MVRSSLLPYAFVWMPYICLGKMLRISKDFSSEASEWANVAQISFGASLGQGNERLLKWLWFIDLDGHDTRIWLKPLKIFFSRTEDAFRLNLCTNHWGQEVHQSC